jgi:hypothetical protein
MKLQPTSNPRTSRSEGGAQDLPQCVKGAVLLRSKVVELGVKEHVGGLDVAMDDGRVSWMCSSVVASWNVAAMWCNHRNGGRVFALWNRSWRSHARCTQTLGCLPLQVQYVGNRKKQSAPDEGRHNLLGMQSRGEESCVVYLVHHSTRASRRRLGATAED